METISSVRFKSYLKRFLLILLGIQFTLFLLLILLGIIYSREVKLAYDLFLGDKSKSEKNLERFYKWGRDNDVPDLTFHYSEMLREYGDNEAADNVLKLALDKGSLLALEQCFRIAQKNDYKEAIVLGKIARDRGSSVPLVFLGEDCLKRGDENGAKSYFESANLLLNYESCGYLGLENQSYLEVGDFSVSDNEYFKDGIMHRDARTYYFAGLLYSGESTQDKKYLGLQYLLEGSYLGSSEASYYIANHLLNLKPQDQSWTIKCLIDYYNCLGSRFADVNHEQIYGAGPDKSCFDFSNP